MDQDLKHVTEEGCGSAQNIVRQWKGKRLIIPKISWLIRSPGGSDWVGVAGSSVNVFRGLDEISSMRSWYLWLSPLTVRYACDNRTVFSHWYFVNDLQRITCTVCSDRLSVRTYIAPPTQVAPTRRTYSWFSLPPPAGAVDMWAAGTHAGSLPLFNPGEEKKRKFAESHAFDLVKDIDVGHKSKPKSDINFSILQGWVR